MPQVDPKILDYSSEMKSYFQEVTSILMQQFKKSPSDARGLVDRYFALNVDPLERAFVMHTAAETVAADLASVESPNPSHSDVDSRDIERRPSRFSAE